MTCFLSLPGVCFVATLPRKDGILTDGIMSITMVRWDISLALNMTCFLSPIVGVADTSPEGGSRNSFRKLCPEGGSETTRHSERSEESHRVSAEYIICGNSPSREIAAVVSLPRKDSFFVIARN